jgi:hypothetical protein
MPYPSNSFLSVQAILIGLQENDHPSPILQTSHRPMLLQIGPLIKDIHTKSDRPTETSRYVEVFVPTFRALNAGQFGVTEPLT